MNKEDQITRFIEVLEEETPFIISSEQRRRIRERIAPKPAPKTVPVRIAVIVKPDGRWSAGGTHEFSDAQVIDEARSELDAGDRLVWVTANVPLPEETEVRGEVEG